MVSDSSSRATMHTVEPIQSSPSLPSEILRTIIEACIFSTPTVSPKPSVLVKAKELALVSTAFLDWTIAACKARIELYYAEVQSKIDEALDEYGGDVPEDVEESVDNVAQWAEEGEKEISEHIRRLEQVRDKLKTVDVKMTEGSNARRSCA